MRNVAFIIPCIGSGGAERVVVNLANQMSKDGTEVEIYTILSSEEYYPLDPRVKHIDLGKMPANKVLRIFKRYRTLQKKIRESKADTVVAFDRNYGLTCSLGSGKRVIGSERNDPYSNMPRHSPQKYFRDWLYTHADYVVFQTAYAQNYFSDKIKSHSRIIHNPISTEILPEPYTGIRRKAIVAICRLTAQKNIPMLINAFKMFEEKNAGYTLEIYGDGPLRKMLEEMVQQKGLERKVVFMGFVSDVLQKTRDASLFASSSDYEGISNSMLEAMAIGIPVVCTDCPAGGAAMMIKDKKNGRLVPVRDETAMSRAMCEVVEDPKHSALMALDALRVRETCDIIRISKQWEAVI